MIRFVRALGSFVARRRWVTGLLVVLLLLGAVLGGAEWWDHSHYQAARKALATENYREARAQVQKCLGIWPTGLAPHLLAARIERLDNHFDEAEKCLKECKRLAGKTTPEIQLERYLLRAQQGEVDAVADMLWQCVNEGELDTPAILETLALVYLQQSRFRPALFVLDRWVKDEPNNPRPLDWRSHARLRTEQTDLAANDCVAALELDPTLASVRLRLCDLLMAQRRFDKAEPHLHYLREHHPDRPEALIGLARCRMEECKWDEGRELLDQALKADPDLISALQVRGDLELRDGQFPAAESWLRRYLDKVPSSMEAVDLLHRCLKQQPGRAEDAAKTLARYQFLRSSFERYSHLLNHTIDAGGHNNPENATEIAELLLKMGLDKQVPGWLYLALKENPNYVPAHRVAIRYYQKHNQPNRVEEHRRLVAQFGDKEPDDPKPEEKKEPRP